MIGRGQLRITRVLSVSVLTAGLVCAGFMAHPLPAHAESGEAQQTISHVVNLDRGRAVTPRVTSSTTVAEFLHEAGIVPGAHDYVFPALDAPISDDLTVTYRAAVPVTIQQAHGRRNVMSSAQDVGDLLLEQHVLVSPRDLVRPGLAEPVPPNGTVRISRVLSWNRTEHRAITAEVIHRFDAAMAPGSEKIVDTGAPGEREVMVRITQRDDGKVDRAVLSSQIVRKPRPRIIAEGLGEYERFARFARRGLERTSYIAAAALNMIATAYTANCTGCSGTTAIGRPAGHGIVAVDPRIIPLGARLFIPGYGLAIAGDTGGAIQGKRIDLGFDSEHDARLFGRREVVVYRLK